MISYPKKVKKLLSMPKHPPIYPFNDLPLMDINMAIQELIMALHFRNSMKLSKSLSTSIVA